MMWRRGRADHDKLHDMVRELSEGMFNIKREQEHMEHRERTHRKSKPRSCMKKRKRERGKKKKER